MPLFDFRCPSCQAITPDIYASAEAGGAKSVVLLCPVCDTVLEWIPAVGSMDAKEPFQQFEVYDGRNRKVTVGSLHQLRKIERESEQQARNGEGQQMVWRKYAQDAGNVHTHTLAADPSQAPERRAAEKFSKAIHRGEPTVTYGPGVGDHNTSALKE